MRSAGSLALILLLFAGALRASEMRVSATRITADESLVVTISLEGSFADIDAVSLPLTNLIIAGGPAVESQYQWSNGRSFSRRNLRYTLRPRGPGAASIGAIMLVAPDGSKQQLPQVDIQVVPEIGADAESPVAQLRQLADAGRDRVVLSAEPSTDTPYIGQQVTVTWFLYTQESIRDVRLSGNPSTGDFWTEEIPIEDGEQFDVIVDGLPLKKVAVRRVALFPLRNGVLTVTPMELRISVMEALDDPFGGFFRRNFRERDVTRRSRALELNVREVPDNLEQVGSYLLSCTPPVASAAGPITFDVSLTGDGNIRAAQPPSFARAVAGRLDFAEGNTQTRRLGDRLQFTRRWRAILFPEQAGPIAVPPVSFRYYDVVRGAEAVLTCGGGNVLAVAAPRPVGATRRSTGPRSGFSALRIALTLSLVAALLGAAWFLIARVRRRRLLERKVTELFSPEESTRDVRRRLYDWARERTGMAHDDLLLEASERGDLFRAAVSVLDLRASTERERSVELERELTERLGALLKEVESKKR